MLALAKGDDAAQRQAIHFLRHVEPQEWAAAPVAVCRSVVASLQQQVLHGMKPPSVHREIATILGNMGPRSEAAVPQLIQLLQDGVPDSVRNAAAIALGNVGGGAREAVDRLLVLCNGHTALAIHAVRALGGIGWVDDRVRSALVTLWLSSVQSQSGHIQVALAVCKLRIAADGLLGFLTQNLIASQDDGLRQSAAEALGCCSKSDMDVVPALLTATFGDKNEEVRQRAEAALDQLRVPHDKALLLCSRQLGTSAIAETALRKSGPLAVPALIEALDKGEPATRVKAARLLGSLGEAAVAAVPALTTALHDRNADIRLAAAKGLWNVNKQEAEVVVPVLVHLLEEKRTARFDDAESRRRFLQTVMEALGRIGPPAKAAVPALMDKTKDANRLLSESARDALRRIGAPRAN
jgi:HEAT repeat protein